MRCVMFEMLIWTSPYTSANSAAALGPRALQDSATVAAAGLQSLSKLKV